MTRAAHHDECAVTRCRGHFLAVAAGEQLVVGAAENGDRAPDVSELRPPVGTGEERDALAHVDLAVVSPDHRADTRLHCNVGRAPPTQELRHQRVDHFLIAPGAHSFDRPPAGAGVGIWCGGTTHQHQALDAGGRDPRHLERKVATER